MPSAEALGAICVQRFDDSRNSAIHTTYRISLRSSSLREPRYPLLRVVSVEMSRLGRAHIFGFRFDLVLLVSKDQPNCPSEWTAGPNPSSNVMPPGKHQTPERMMGQTKMCTVWLLIDSMILPQVHLRKPCYDFSFL